MVHATVQLPGVKTEEEGVKTTRQEGEHRLYAICRRLQERITDLEKRVSTLGTTCARIERQNYRGAEATKHAPPFPVKPEDAGGNGDGNQATIDLLCG